MRKADNKRHIIRIEKTSFHEAGHAVAHCFLSIPFKHVTIKENEDSWGHIKPSILPKSFNPERIVVQVHFQTKIDLY